MASVGQCCAACYGSVGRLELEAAFTSECAHTFHPLCVSGAHTCPSCSAFWHFTPTFQPSPLLPQPARMPPLHPGPASRSACGVCKCAFGYGAPTFTSECQHRFHLACVTGSACPVCNARWAYRVSSHPYFHPYLYPPPPPMPSPLIPPMPSPLMPPMPTFLSPFVDQTLPAYLPHGADAGSMAGRKIALLKKAMEFVVDQLGPADRLSVVAFSTYAYRVIPLTCMSDAGKAKAKLAVQLLNADGGTNILKGLTEAAKVLVGRRHKNAVASVILLSDGQDTRPLDRGAPTARRVRSRRGEGHDSGMKRPHERYDAGLRDLLGGACMPPTRGKATAAAERKGKRSGTSCSPPKPLAGGR
ncbi:hypothetical protein D1007_17659 [Hordeum vulgare]|nr:hypothetical protein D1007_17659 [Hordeum vulgare]